jgi:hypothetical protein
MSSSVTRQLKHSVNRFDFKSMSVVQPSLRVIGKPISSLKCSEVVPNYYGESNAVTWETALMTVQGA